MRLFTTSICNSIYVQANSVWRLNLYIQLFVSSHVMTHIGQHLIFFDLGSIIGVRFGLLAWKVHTVHQTNKQMSKWSTQTNKELGFYQVSVTFSRHSLTKPDCDSIMSFIWLRKYGKTFPCKNSKRVTEPKTLYLLPVPVFQIYKNSDIFGLKSHLISKLIWLL